MVLNKDEIIHIFTRRRYADDVRRHFVGRVVEATDVSARVEGFAFVFDPNRNEYVKREHKRMRIIALADSGNIINVLPLSVELEELKYAMSDRGKLVVTDGRSFALYINECGANR